MNKPKRTVSWFRHYCRHGDSLPIVEGIWGERGYTCWFKLLERLGASDNHTLNDATDHKKLMLIWAQSGLNQEEGRQVFSLFAELEMIDKELHSGGIIWCQNLVDGISEVYAKRTLDTPTKPEYAPDKAKEGDRITKTGDRKTGSRIDEVDVVDKIEKKYKTLCPDSQRLAGLLAELILEHSPNHKELNTDKIKSTINRWSYDIDLMQRKDNRDVSDIEKVIRWAQNDTFWHKNIQSGAKLRKQFDRLSLEVSRRTLKVSNVGIQSHKAGENALGGEDAE